MMADIWNRQTRALSLHLLVLWNLAVAQPLLSVLAASPELFVAHGSTRVEIVTLVMTLCFVAPSVLVLLVLIARGLGPRLSRAIEHAIVASLLALLALVWIKRLLDPPATAAILVAIGVSAAVTAAYSRVAAVRTLVTYLSPALIVTPLAFLLGSGIAHLMFPPAAAAPRVQRVTADTPVVVVVFDEMPLVSLLDERREIDVNAYPNFARLAREGHWFRNTTTVAQSTFYAIPAILTGQYPTSGRLPIASDHPNSLFTLLADSHDLHVYESGTQMCPSPCGGNAVSAGTTRRLSRLTADIWVVYLHIVLPSSIEARLPTLNRGWNNFAWDETGAASEPVTADQMNKRFVSAVEADRVALFESFIESIGKGPRPGLYYIHSMITHVPWLNLPSGRLHGLGSGTVGLQPREELWSPDDFLVAQAYQRHLLEVRFADRLLGRVVTRLQQAGLYDRALLVVTADHGSSFRAGDRRRQLNEMTLKEILPVPLLIKLPGEKGGGMSDASVETIDILPTIAEVLDIDLPWKADGHSLLAPADPADHRDRRAVDDTSHVFPVRGPTTELVSEPLSRKTSLLAMRTPEERLWRDSLLDQPVRTFPTTQAPGITAQLRRRGGIDVEPDSPVLPVDVQGLIGPATDGPLPTGEPYVAVAVNGVIRDVTKTFRGGQYLRFATLLPEHALRVGHNVVEVYVIERESAGTKLLTIPRRGARETGD